MTTTFDTEMIAVATELLDEFGTSATITTVTRGRTDGMTNTKAPDSTSTQVTKAAPPDLFTRAFSPGGAVSSEKLVTIVGTTKTDGTALTEPTTSDRLTIANETYRIAKVSPVMSGDDVAAYMLEIAST